MNFSQILNEIEFQAVRSRGPGGQNVNKVASAALLFWSFEWSNGLTLEQKALVRRKLANCINREGMLYLRSDEFRDLEMNKGRCIEKLRNLLTVALHKPKPRRATKPTRASKEKKRELKTRRSETKKSRQKIRF